jgi:glyoxylase-like metal-dependent hydrolase (beta-lactamase superfamily II)
VSQLPPIEVFESDSGVRLYQMPLEAFPGFIVFSYLLLGTDVPTLVDCGSGMDKSNEDLLAALQAVQDDFGEALHLEDIQRIIVTHGHIDHHGGVSFVRERIGGAHVGIHALDRRILTAYEERVVIASKNLRVYLQRAGVTEETTAKLMDMYGFGKRLLKSEKVDFLLEENGEIDGMRFYHVPGHCPGQVCIQIGDVMLTADHVLNRITPHQAPESITHCTGLGHYLASLEKIKQLSGIRLALGGHEDPIHDLYGRIDAIQVDHQAKLERVCAVIAEAKDPITISDISKTMYPDMKSYNILLALEEVGAHVEYLYEHGELLVANLDEVEKEDNPPLRYCIV